MNILLKFLQVVLFVFLAMILAISLVQGIQMILEGLSELHETWLEWRRKK